MNIAEHDFSYLIPPAEVFDVHHDPYYIQHGEENKSVRKVFDCVPYTEYEKQKLAEFEAMIKKEGIQLPPGWRTAYTMRFLYSAKFALDKCLENLKVYLEWLSHPNRKVVPAKSIELLKQGLMYMAGRDKQFRPIIVVNVDRIDLKKMSMEDFTEALCALCSVLEKYCYVPGKVENWIIIIETNSVSMWNFPFKIVQNLVATTSISFTSTLDKLYIMNPSKLLKGSWSLIQKLMHPETAAKISMIDKSEYKQLLEKIPIDQIEEKYGGTLPNHTTFWPPKNTLNKPPYRKPHEDPTKDPRKNLEIDTTGSSKGKDLGRTPSLKGALSPNDKMSGSIYYDFDTIYVEVPELDTDKGFERNGNRNHIPIKKEPLVLEGNMKQTGCCGMRRGSESKSDGCNMF